MNSYIPGIPVEYSKDGGVTWTKARQYKAIKNEKPKMLARTR